MALTTADMRPAPAAQPAETKPYTVLRAISIAGERVEVGAVVRLTRQQAQELAAAGKVSREPAESGEAAPVSAKARPRAPSRGKSA